METKITKNTCFECGKTSKYKKKPIYCKYCGCLVGNRYVDKLGKIYIDGNYFGQLGIGDTIIHLMKNSILFYFMFQMLLSLLISVPVATLTLKLFL